MRQIVFYFDVVSPLAWLAFEQMPQALAGVSHWVDYRPVLRQRLSANPACVDRRPKVAAFQDEVARGQLIAGASATPFAPPAQPFDSGPLLQVALACARIGAGPNRYQVERVMRHIWQTDGSDPCAPERLAALAAELAPRRAIDSPEVRSELAEASDAAALRGITAVPAFEVPSLQVRLEGHEALTELAERLHAAVQKGG